jgi:hypothetical protein
MTPARIDTQPEKIWMDCEAIRKSLCVKHLRDFLATGTPGWHVAKVAPLLRLLGVAALCVAAPSAAQTRADLGAVRLDIRETRDAQVFHVVDQLADWDAHTHRTYLRWAADSLASDSTDRALLARHAELRRAHGWGSGFEDAYFRRDTVPAQQRLVKSRVLSSKEARAEADVLAHFAQRLAPMLDASGPRVHAFAERVRDARDSIGIIITPLAKLSGLREPLDLLVFLVPNPVAGSRGGRFTAGAVIVEVPERPNPLPSLYHELFHAIVAEHAALIRSTATTSHLTFDELNEALAYAFSPGLIETVPDQLSRQLANASNASTHRTLAAAVQLRPMLREALDNGDTMQAFLMRAGALLSHTSVF